MKKTVLLVSFIIVSVTGAFVYLDFQAREKAQAKQEELATVMKIIQESQQEKPDIGYKAPAFQLKGLDGVDYVLNGEREKPLVVNFWASWCGPCREEAPYLRALHQKYKDKVDVYAINLEGSGDMDAVKSFVKAAKFEMPVPVDKDGKVGDKYKVIGIPTTFFITKSGVIQNKLVGGADQATLEKYTQDLLKK